MFDLESDVAARQQAMIAAMPELAPAIAQRPGLRLLRPSDPVETLFCFLCTSNNHLIRITSMIQTLGSFGTPFADRPELTRFPELEVIASIPEADLRARGFGYRGATIPRAAQAILERGGRHWLDALKRSDYESAWKALLDLPGVGPKLADCIALYALHHTEAVPVDTHMWQVCVRRFFPEWHGKAVTLSRYCTIGEFFRERHGRWAGHAHHYLFFDNLARGRSRREA